RRRVPVHDLPGDARQWHPAVPRVAGHDEAAAHRHDGVRHRRRGADVRARVMDPKRVVRNGYDRAAAEYEQWSARVDEAPRTHYLERLAELVPAGATLLELGCGTGLATVELTRHFAVIGVDFSTAVLQRARTNAPAAHYVRADMTQLGIRPSSI